MEYQPDIQRVFHHSPKDGLFFLLKFFLKQNTINLMHVFMIRCLSYSDVCAMASYFVTGLVNPEQTVWMTVLTF